MIPAAPTPTTDGSDGQWPELVKRKRALRVMLEQMLDPIQLGVPVRVVGRFPRLGPLERDVMVDQELAEPFPADLHHPVRVVRHIADQFPDAPPSKRQPQLLGTGRGRLDDEGLIVSRDLAGTATRPPRVQGLHSHLVEPVDHLPNPVFRGGNQPGDHRHRVPTRRGVHHQCSPPLHMRLVGLAAPAPHDPLNLLALCMGQPSDPKLFRHPTMKPSPELPMVDPTPTTGSWSQH